MSWKRYTIEKGHHVSEPVKLGLHAGGFPHLWRMSVIFGRGCAYDFGNHPDRYDINKLWGYSQWNHMANSFRVGWRWNRESSMVELLPFVTSRGYDNRFSAPVICEVPLEQAIETEILVGRGSCQFRCDGKSADVALDRKLSPIRFGYFLRPYFGGNRVAPHDIEIHLRK